MMRKKENFDDLSAGIKVFIRTEPDRKAPVKTRSHCRTEICELEIV